MKCKVSKKKTKKLKPNSLSMWSCKAITGLIQMYRARNIFLFNFQYNQIDSKVSVSPLEFNSLEKYFAIGKQFNQDFISKAGIIDENGI